MTKKLNRHSLHLSDELETLVKKRLEAGGFASVNAYFEWLVEREREFLKGCDTAAKIAGRWRRLRKILWEDRQKPGGE